MFFVVLFVRFPFLVGGEEKHFKCSLEPNLSCKHINGFHLSPFTCFGFDHIPGAAAYYTIGIRLSTMLSKSLSDICICSTGERKDTNVLVDRKE